VIHLILTVKGRLEFTKKTLDSLHPTLAGKVSIWCVDNGSLKDTQTYLRSKRDDKTICSLIVNRAGTVPQWEKCHAIVQAWSNIAPIIKPADYVGWIDNDVEVKPSWVDIPAKVLALSDVDVCSLHNDSFQDTRHPTALTVQVDGFAVRLKPTANGAFWVMRSNFFSEYGLPPVGKGAGKDGVEDWHYSRMLMKRHKLFGVVDGISEHLGYSNSLRKKIGA
jgi:hypothetical protein